MDRRDLIGDSINLLELLSRKPEMWKTYESHDDIMRELKFTMSSLKNAKVDTTLLMKSIDALMLREIKLAYSILYSDNKLGTQAELILDNKFNNNKTNFLKTLKALKTL